MTEKYCDLHVHSYCSDGSLSPTELIDMARNVGLSAVALCDHNTIMGAKEFLCAAEKAGIEGIAGVEFSTEYKEKELHILGLNIPETEYEKVETWVAGMNRRKEESNILLIENLQKDGYAITYEEVVKRSIGQPNRAHVATILWEKGYVPSVKEAFKTLLVPGGKYYVEPRRLNVFDTIAFIKSIGGVAVWAHPFLNMKEQDAREFLSVAIGYGLDGMETQYSKYSEETTAMAKRLAQEFGILESGGSDFHGLAKPDVEMGTGKGNLKIPLSIWENLKIKGAGTR